MYRKLSNQIPKFS